MLGLQVCFYIAPRGCAVHSGLASRSQRPKVLWVVTGREASKWGIFPLFTVLVVWKSREGSLVPCPVPPRSENLLDPQADTSLPGLCSLM